MYTASHSQRAVSPSLMLPVLWCLFLCSVICPIVALASSQPSVIVNDIAPVPEPLRWLALDLSVYVHPTFVPVFGSGCTVTVRADFTHGECREDAEVSGAGLYGYQPTGLLCTVAFCSTPTTYLSMLRNATLLSEYRDGVPLQYVYTLREHLQRGESYYCDHARAYCHGRSVRQEYNSTSNGCCCICRNGFDGDRCQITTSIGAAWPGDQVVLQFDASPVAATILNVPGTVDLATVSALDRTAAAIDLLMRTGDSVATTALPSAMQWATQTEIEHLLETPFVVAAKPYNSELIAGGSTVVPMAISATVSAEHTPLVAGALARALRAEALVNATDDPVANRRVTLSLLQAVAADLGGTVAQDVITGDVNVQLGVYVPESRRAAHAITGNLSQALASQATDPIAPAAEPVVRLSGLQLFGVLNTAVCLAAIIFSLYSLASVVGATVTDVGTHHYDGRDRRLTSQWMRTHMLVSLLWITLVFAIGVVSLSLLSRVRSPVEPSDDNPGSHSLVILDYGDSVRCSASRSFTDAPMRIGRAPVQHVCFQVEFATGASTPGATGRHGGPSLFVAASLNPSDRTLSLINGSSMDECQSRLEAGGAFWHEIPWSSVTSLMSDCALLNAAARWRVLVLQPALLNTVLQSLSEDHIIAHHTAPDATGDETVQGVLYVAESSTTPMAGALSAMRTAQVTLINEGAHLNASGFAAATRENPDYTTPSFARVDYGTADVAVAPTNSVVNRTGLDLCPFFGEFTAFGFSNTSVHPFTHGITPQCNTGAGSSPSSSRARAIAAGRVSPLAVEHVAGALFDPNANRKGITEGGFTLTMWVRLSDRAASTTSSSSSTDTPVHFRGLLFVIADATLQSDSDAGELPSHLAAALEQLANEPSLEARRGEDEATFRAENEAERESKHRRFTSAGLPIGASAISFGIYLDTAARELSLVFRPRGRSSVERLALRRVDLSTQAASSAVFSLASNPNVWRFIAVAVSRTDGRYKFTISVDAEHGVGHTARSEDQVCSPIGFSFPTLIEPDTSRVGIRARQSEAGVYFSPAGANSTTEPFAMKKGGAAWVGVTLYNPVDEPSLVMETFSVRLQRGALPQQRLMTIAGLLRADVPVVGNESSLANDTTVETARQRRHDAERDVTWSAVFSFVCIVLALAFFLLGSVLTLLRRIWRLEAEAAFKRLFIVEGRAAADRRLAAVMFAVPFGIHHFTVFLSAWEWPAQFRYISSSVVFVFTFQPSVGFPSLVPGFVDFVIHVAAALVSIFVIHKMAHRDTDQFLGRDLEMLAFVRRSHHHRPLIDIPAMYDPDGYAVDDETNNRISLDIRARWEAGTLPLAGIAGRVVQPVGPDSTDDVSPFSNEFSTLRKTIDQDATDDENFAARAAAAENMQTVDPSKVEPRVFADTPVVLEPSPPTDEAHLRRKASDTSAKLGEEVAVQLAVSGRFALGNLQEAVEELTTVQVRRLKELQVSPFSGGLTHRRADEAASAFNDDADTFINEVFAVGELKQYGEQRQRMQKAAAHAQALKALREKNLISDNDDASDAVGHLAPSLDTIQLPPAPRVTSAGDEARHDGDESTASIIQESSMPAVETLIKPLTADRVIFLWVPVQRGESDARERLARVQEEFKVWQHDQALGRTRAMMERKPVAVELSSNDSSADDIIDHGAKSATPTSDVTHEPFADDKHTDEATPDRATSAAPTASEAHFGLSPAFSAALLSAYEEYAMLFFRDHFADVVDQIEVDDEADIVIGDVTRMATSHAKHAGGLFAQKSCAGVLRLALERIDIPFGTLEQAAFEYITGEAIDDTAVGQRARVAALFMRAATFLRQHAVVLSVFSRCFDDIEHSLRSRAASETREALAERLQASLVTARRRELDGDAARSNDGVTTSPSGRKRRVKEDPARIAAAVIRLHDACHGILFTESDAHGFDEHVASADPVAERSSNEQGERKSTVSFELGDARSFQTGNLDSAGLSLDAPPFAALLRALETRRDAYVLADAERQLVHRPRWPPSSQTRILPFVRELAEYIFPKIRSHHATSSDDTRALFLDADDDVHIRLFQLVLLHPSTHPSVVQNVHIFLVLKGLVDAADGDIAKWEAETLGAKENEDEAADDGELSDFSGSHHSVDATGDDDDAALDAKMNSDAHYDKLVTGDVSDIVKDQPSFAGLLYRADAAVVARNLLNFASGLVSVRAMRLTKLAGRATRLTPADPDPALIDPFDANALRLVHARVSVARSVETCNWQATVDLLDSSPTAAVTDFVQDVDTRIARAIEHEVLAHREQLTRLHLQQVRELRRLRAGLVEHAGAGVGMEGVLNFHDKYGRMIRRTAVDLLPSDNEDQQSRTVAGDSRTVDGHAALHRERATRSVADRVKLNDDGAAASSTSSAHARRWWYWPVRRDARLLRNDHPRADVIAQSMVVPKLQTRLCPDHLVPLSAVNMADYTAYFGGDVVAHMLDRANAVEHSFWYKYFVSPDTPAMKRAVEVELPSSGKEEIVSCPHPQCDYHVTQHIVRFTERTIPKSVTALRVRDRLYAAISIGWSRAGGSLRSVGSHVAVFVVLLVMVPAMWTCMAVIACHSSTVCYFPDGCVGTHVAEEYLFGFVISCLTIVAILFGFGIDTALRVYRRKLMLLHAGVILASDFAEEGYDFPGHTPYTAELPEAWWQVLFFTMPDRAWQRIIADDHSFLRLLYVPFRCRYAAVGFAGAVWVHFILVLAVTLLPGDSIEQLIAVAIVEVIAMIVFAVLQPFSDASGNAMAQTTQCATVGIIGLSAAARISRYAWDPEVFQFEAFGEAYPLEWTVAGVPVSSQRFDMFSVQISMFVVASVWVIILIAFLASGVVVPYVRGVWSQDGRRNRDTRPRRGTGLLKVASDMTSNLTSYEHPVEVDDGEKQFRLTPRGNRERAVRRAESRSEIAGRSLLRRVHQGWLDRKIEIYPTLRRLKQGVVASFTSMFEQHDRACEALEVKAHQTAQAADPRDASSPLGSHFHVEQSMWTAACYGRDDDVAHLAIRDGMKGRDQQTFALGVGRPFPVFTASTAERRPWSDDDGALSGKSFGDTPNNYSSSCNSEEVEDELPIIRNLDAGPGPSGNEGDGAQRAKRREEEMRQWLDAVNRESVVKTAVDGIVRDMHRRIKQQALAEAWT